MPLFTGCQVPRIDTDVDLCMTLRLTKPTYTKLYFYKCGRIARFARQMCAHAQPVLERI